MSESVVLSNLSNTMINYIVTGDINQLNKVTY